MVNSISYKKYLLSRFLLLYFALYHPHTDAHSKKWYKDKGKLSLCHSGMDSRFLKTQKIVVDVLPTHPLIKLMNALDWERLGQIILPDLKKSTSQIKMVVRKKIKNTYTLRRFLAAAAFK
jgi:hypothetical protein